MYEMLIMLKPDATFSCDEMATILRNVGQLSGKTVECLGTSVTLKSGDAYLQVDFSNAPHVIEESKEIAVACDIPCHRCAVRFEMNGDDPDMDLFNDYLLVNERLDSTGNFFIFDPSEGKLFGR